MKISGLQKLTLLDFPAKTACTVFTSGCNLRCPFCHNSSLAKGSDKEIITEEEFFSFLRNRKSLLDGVCITGGEPLMQKDLTAFILRCRNEGFSIKLDTNGFFPNRLKELIDNKLLDYVAMDVKNTVQKYALTTGIPDVNKNGVEESIKLIMSSGIDYEFRTTAVKNFHEVKDFYTIAQMIRGAKNYYIQLYKDSDNVMCKGLSPLDENDMLLAKREAERILKNVVIRGM